MAVIEVVDVVSRKFSGWDEPQFPSGFWQAAARVVGDATGGDMTAQINFSLATAQFNSQYYSWEDVMISLDEETNVLISVLVANMGIVGDVTGRRYTIPVLANNGGFAGMEGKQSPLLPIFLGQQNSPSSTTSISFSRDNDNLDVLDVQIGGYIWSARSTSVPGGPQRPPTGLYRL